MSWIGLEDVMLRYELSGRGSPVLVLLHELGGSLESFDGLMPQLEAHFRVLRYDQRGAGGSEKPRLPFSMADHADDLDQLVTALGLPTPLFLAGVAAGAAIAVAYALDAPQAVAALALCAPALTVERDRVDYLAARSELAVTEGMAAIVDGSLERSYPLIMQRDPATYAAYRSRFLANDPVGYAHANLALAHVQLEPRLEELRQPCLLLAGTHDLLRPPQTVAPLAARIGHGSFDVIDSGHLMPVQAPEEMGRQLVNFFAAARRNALVRAS